MAVPKSRRGDAWSGNGDIPIAVSLSGGLGTAMAAIAGGTIDRATAVLICWVLAAVLGIAALCVVVLNDGAARRSHITRSTITIGLLLGIVSAARWLWLMESGGHRYEKGTWIVWLLLLSGPLVIAALRLVELWRPRCGANTQPQQ